MSRVLITGANGFIGANIVRAALEKGYEVNAFVRKTSDIQALEGLPIKYAYGDLRDINSLRPWTIVNTSFTQEQYINSSQCGSGQTLRKFKQCTM